MTTPEPVAGLLARLDLIAAGLEASGQALALLGLGSVGAELDRADRYSDLDFFVLARPGQVGALLEDLGWLGVGSSTPSGTRRTVSRCCSPAGSSVSSRCSTRRACAARRS
ncbi:hypothetical protein ACFQDE_00875 [Deinococcus caeni]|uniref:hypothetical protein n=1 Tax=Deinococcus caeni TaxID=569127 RepID=UPI003618A210